uniref:Uncharacterized protein n=1 Tax=Glossina brevipalpis TaxID=37001 RepID=A0A1A9WJ13_9MUSC
MVIHTNTQHNNNNNSNNNSNINKHWHMLDDDELMVQHTLSSNSRLYEVLSHHCHHHHHHHHHHRHHHHHLHLHLHRHCHRHHHHHHFHLYDVLIASWIDDWLRLLNCLACLISVVIVCSFFTLRLNRQILGTHRLKIPHDNIIAIE